MDKEHSLLLKEVWFNKFDKMFDEDYKIAMLAKSADVKDKTLYVGSPSTGYRRIVFHPDMIENHYLTVLYEIKKASHYSEACMFLVVTNICIELLIMEVSFCIVEAYWDERLPNKEFDHLFRMYNNISEERENERYTH